ncbi:hypothetical protein K0817_011495 [Microbacterium sp. HD4P20]|uniref:hypothetical protein n=1 Tax=Microbacterium sp. HD4P20 TaxID=2864874 RepID=UPI001C64239E|nr:hypothetical protein [Microbacterium sp. HD4P20]MCP2637182.1 hypothetical protein [Microbacterium sp. HD4P20]
MDRWLISLKFAMLRNSSAGLRRAGWVIGALLVVATWAGAALAADSGVRHDFLTLVLAMWLIGGMFGPVLMSGAGVLRADYFALLPLSRGQLGRGLLATVFVGVAATYVLLAVLAVSWHAAVLSPVTIVVAVVGSILTWILVIALSRLVYGALGAAMRTRLGIEIAGVQWGILLAAMFAGWMIVSVAFQSIPQLLQAGLPAGPITAVLDSLPTSWTVLAVEAAAAGDWGTSAAWLAALVVLDVVCVVSTVALLVPRSQRVTARRGRPRSRALVAGGGILPATPTGAVIMKELRQWRRDPWRALEASTAVWTGAVIGVFALLGGYTAPAGAFAGVIVAIMVALSGCNLYGQDGSAVWQNVVGESTWSVRADVRGRQWAMALVFLPRALLVSIVFVLLAQAWWAIPFVIAALPATVGAAAGAAILTSAVGVSPGVDPRRRVGPNDANGNIALHIWIALAATAIGVAPTIGMIVWSATSGSTPVMIATAIVGVLNGFVAAWLLGRVAIGYLSTRMVDVFSRIRYGRIFRDTGSGLLDQLAASTLKGEQVALEAKQKERDKRLERARTSA